MPVAQGRPRFTRRGIAYTPAKTRKAKEEIRALVKAAYKGEPLTDEISVTIAFVFPPRLKLKDIPHPFPLPHTKKPDIDNLTKLVLDALNGVLWVDDAQIWELKAVKVQVNRKPCIELIVN
jgi:Holliday junction resolvase RusA-like endonuclease